MKQGLFFAALMLLMGAQTAVDAQGLAVSDVQNSGCLRSTRAQVNENEQRRTIILTKEGDILSVQLLGFRANCCISGFDVKSNMKDGSETMPCLLSVSVGSYSDEEEECDCICPYNISFTINGVEVNSFRFSCWWYDGLVSLTEGEPLALEDIKEDVSIDGTIYTLDKVAHTAKLIRKNAGESEVNIPSELSYEGQEYTVNSIGSYVFHSNAALTSVTIPSSISYIGDATFYGCSNLKEFCCQADDVPVTGSWVFDNTPIASATLHVPAGSIEEYKATSPWSGFGNIVALPEEPHQPLPFLEGNPIWVFKYEHMPTPRSNDWMKYWLDTGDRYFNYYFLGGKKELEGKVYTMMHEVGCDRDGKITFKRSLPVREENGIVYTITDSLPGVDELYYDYEIPYLQEGDECVLYNFSTEIGEALNPQGEDKLWTVESYSTYQLMDGTECRVLKTHWEDYYYLYEKLGYLNRDDQEYGIMDPLSGMLIATNGHVYENLLNAYYQDDTMLYKAPDALEGLCVNDTCWTHDDAYKYAMSYKANPYHEEVMSYIRQLQAAENSVTFTKDQMATIILPSAPDASKGKYYRLDRCEDGQIIFEQELQPRAHVPYIIVPDEDFSIDPRAFDLSGLNSDTVSIDGISFIGSYTGEVLPSLGGEGGGSFYIDIIDTTPDCSLSPSGGTGKAAVIGALRAYLLVDWVKLNWNDPYDQGGTKGPWEGMPIVLHDDGNGMIEIENGKFNNQNEGEVANGKWSNGKCYDLSGRKIVNRKSSNSKSHRVIYIVDGKKTMK
ncbi:MAG: leucine-rich repeat protein [Bacteroidaceae bacterium]|nr:leucine-rich repeat protein [Bacteroidaceae bacterium]